MMKRSRALEIERLENEKRKALEREGRAEDATAVWEREIMPDWRRVLRSGKDKDADRLRNMWWGGIPGKLRGRLWAAVVGNGLALSKGRQSLGLHVPLFFFLNHGRLEFGCLNSVVLLPPRDLPNMLVTSETRSFLWFFPR
jgi:hypothetical protein